MGFGSSFKKAAGGLTGGTGGMLSGAGGLLGGMQGGVPGGGGTPTQGIASGAGAFDINSFITDNPQYQFLQDEGIRGLERSAAAQGGFGGGGLMKDLVSFSSGLASQSYNTEMDRIMKMSGIDQSSPSTAGQVYGQQASQGTGYGQEALGSLGGIFSLFQ